MKLWHIGLCVLVNLQKKVYGEHYDSSSEKKNAEKEMKKILDGCGSIRKRITQPNSYGINTVVPWIFVEDKRKKAHTPHPIHKNEIGCQLND